jgi:eukaryotic translation initiation factor 2C
MRQRLATPAQIPKWIVIDFANVDPAVVHYFVGELLQAMRDLGLLHDLTVKLSSHSVIGMQVPSPEGVERRSTQGDVLQVRKIYLRYSVNSSLSLDKQELENLRRQYNPSLIIAILPDPAEEQYRQIKRFGDITWGVATQCVVRICLSFSINAEAYFFLWLSEVE